MTDDKISFIYAATIFSETPVPQLNKLKTIFQSLSKENFIELIGKITGENDHNSFQLFLYYIILFRDLSNIQEYINSDDFNIDMLEKLVMFAFGHCSISGYTTERILDEILFFLSEEKLLSLSLYSKHVSKDKLLLFFIMTKLSTDSLNKFMETHRNVNEVAEHFLKLPDEVMKAIIIRNYRLFQYIMLMLAEDETAKKITKSFYEKYKSDIEQLSKLNDVIRKYKKDNDLEAERKFPFKERNMSRISFLVNKIRETDDFDKTISYFDGEKVFADEAEREIIRAIVTNPILKNTFTNYDKVFSW